MDRPPAVAGLLVQLPGRPLRPCRRLLGPQTQAVDDGAVGGAGLADQAGQEGADGAAFMIARAEASGATGPPAACLDVAEEVLGPSVSSPTPHDLEAEAVVTGLL